MIYAAATLLVVATGIAEEACTCANAAVHSEWCPACSKGYVAGITIESEFLYEVIHPHGHVIDTKRVECKSCQAALQNNGFCTSCRIGYVRNQAYFTTLAYLIAKGNPKRAAKLECQACQANAKRYGWCDACRRGMVGPVEIVDADDYKTAVAAYEIVLAAISMLEKCKWCAAAMVADAFCPTCRKKYKGGKPVDQAGKVPTPRPTSGMHQHDGD